MLKVTEHFDLLGVFFHGLLVVLDVHIPEHLSDGASVSGLDVLDTVGSEPELTCDEAHCVQLIVLFVYEEVNQILNHVLTSVVAEFITGESIIYRCTISWVNPQLGTSSWICCLPLQCLKRLTKLWTVALLTLKVSYLIGKVNGDIELLLNIEYKAKLIHFKE